MKNNLKKYGGRHKILPLAIAMIIAALVLGGCVKAEPPIKLDAKNPVTVSVWHYYNGPILNAFEAMVKEFNETVGLEQGIIVEGFGMGSVGELEAAVIAAANKEIGSMEMPNIFASYADTAYEAEKLGLLANLGDYFTAEEQAEYLDSYIEEGRIGANGELRIFPVAKSTEIMMLNDTDWQPFAKACGLNYDNLNTIEGIAKVAELYYDWSGGKSFFGRDSVANLFIIASKEFGTEIFQVAGGNATINVNASVMRKIWDNYYIPYISGYFSSYGRFRSDDAKVGDILAYIGSTASATYFPSQVTAGGQVYPVTAKVLPIPHFAGARRVMVQQGAGMVVTKGNPEEEYASTVFLKWFTEAQNNLKFAAMSGYLPVKKDAVDYQLMEEQIAAGQLSLDAITDETLRISFEEIQTSELYTNKAFNGGTAARAVLEHNLQDKAVTDREAVLKLLESGSTLQEAVARFNTEENLQKWLNELTQKLNEALK